MLKRLIRLPFRLIGRLLALKPVRIALRWIVLLGVCLAVFSTLWVVAYRFINPPITTLMVIEKLRVDKLEFDWKPLPEISPNLQHAVIAAEDANFCLHGGFSLEDIRKALNDDGRRRGASTISQQTAKNAFLWPDASWLRKGVEVGFTVLVETFWPKSRILEVYLNIAEFGIGVFGAEAAAQYYFGVSAKALTRDQAARMAQMLPSPRKRDVGRVSAARIARINEGVGYIASNGNYYCLSAGEED